MVTRSNFPVPFCDIAHCGLPATHLNFLSKPPVFRCDTHHPKEGSDGAPEAQEGAGQEKEQAPAAAAAVLTSGGADRSTLVFLLGAMMAFAVHRKSCSHYVHIENPHLVSQLRVRLNMELPECTCGLDTIKGRIAEVMRP